MRVLMISLDRGLLGHKGSGDVVERHRKYADLAGHLDVIVLSESPAEKIWSENFRVFSSGSTKWSHYRKTARLAKKLNAENSYDLIVTQDFAAPIGVCLKHTLNKPWIVNVHGMFFERAWLGWDPVKWYLYFRIRRSIRHADGFRVNNVTIQDRLRSWGIAKPILVQPTPIDISKFRNSPNPSLEKRGTPSLLSPFGRSLRQREGGGELKILYVGRLSPEKNVAMLIRAFMNLEHSAELWIVGGGPEEQKLKSLAAGDDRIKFFGAKSLNELPAYYSRADIFVLPSDTESYGQVLLQAAAGGCAIIATATAGAKSILGNSENGMLVPVGSQKALEEALENLITKTFEREYWSTQALALAEKYDGESGVEKTINFWKEMAGQGPDIPAKAPAPNSERGEGIHSQL
ncbi:MAG: hypothetical protein A2787_06565 [Omnitrophica WOR_2 bacterium RIFCSPHIGHO2_01_FULL_48_9]|nr:MAG: hypothetical protein A2787_06565 [Omnitrophica WOR_2 bacterium RIFCSPHIGHO2_01_FULL_48_9]